MDNVGLYGTDARYAEIYVECYCGGKIFLSQKFIYFVHVYKSGFLCNTLMKYSIS